MALLLKEEDVQEVFSMDTALPAMEELFRERGRGNATLRPRTRMATPGGAQNLTAGWVGGSVNAYGIKVYGGPRGDRPPAAILVLLDDGSNGSLLSIMESLHLSRVRTGAATGVATNYMARQDASTAGMIGTSILAGCQLEAVCKVRKIEQAWVYGRNEERRQAFAERMSNELGVPVAAADSGEACVREADIVITNTSSRQPVLEGAWLREGTHINGVGSNSMHRREMDEEAIRRAALIATDDIPQAMTECGKLIAAVARGVVIWEQVHELADVVAGRVPGRPSQESITLFESQGIATEDVAAARVIYEAALKRGLGQEIPL